MQDYRIPLCPALFSNNRLTGPILGLDWNEPLLYN